MKVISCLQGFLDSSVIVLYKKLGNMQEQLFYFFWARKARTRSEPSNALNHPMLRLRFF